MIGRLIVTDRPRASKLGEPEFRNNLLLLSVRPADPVKDRGPAGN